MEQSVFNLGKAVYNPSLGKIEWKESYCTSISNGQCNEMKSPFGVYDLNARKVEWRWNVDSMSHGG